MVVQDGCSSSAVRSWSRGFRLQAIAVAVSGLVGLASARGSEEATQQAAASAAAQAPEETSGDSEAGGGEGRTPPPWLFAMVLLASLAGAVAGSRLRTRRRLTAVVRAGLGTGFPVLGAPFERGSRALALRAAPECTRRDLCLEVIDSVGEHGSVLLVLAEDALEVDPSGQAGGATDPTLPRGGPRGSLWRSEWHRPTAARVLSEAVRIASNGLPLTVVVEGPAALEPCRPHAPAAAMEELLSRCRLPLVFVLSADDAAPAGLRVHTHTSTGEGT